MTVDRFATSTSGSIDFGEIGPDIAKDIGKPPAPIRLRDQGSESGVSHIERKDRLHQIQKAGYANATELVSDVAKNYDSIYAGKGESLVLAKRATPTLIVFIQLFQSQPDFYYDTRSALVVRADYLKHKKLLWERAQSNQFLAKSSSAVSSQSSDENSNMSHTQINLIWAQAHNRVIGKDGVMPWYLPEDLAHFKHMTMGAPVIMGRKTWDSIPAKFRPLPGRINIVVSRNTDFLQAQHLSGMQAIASLEAALDLVSQHPDVWVIGGAQIYAQALPLASKVVVTQIDADYAGDAFAPELGAGWRETAREAYVAANGLRYAFVTFLKKD